MKDLPPEKNNSAWWELGLFLFVKLSGWIAFPIITALFVGRYLDRKFNSEPWLFLLCVGISFGLTSLGIVKEAQRSMRRIELEEQKRDQEKSQRGNFQSD